MRRGRRRTAIFLFISLVLIYHANWLLVHPGDSPANVYTAMSLVEEGNYLLLPTEAPLMFLWQLHTSKGTSPIAIPEMDEDLKALVADGTLTVSGCYPQLVPARLEGTYLSTFGGGSATVAAPAYWLATALYPDYRQQPALLWWIGRFVGAVCVAGSGAFLFLYADEHASRWQAMVLSLAYGLGTCVWSTSSQALWQHGPNELFVAAGLYALSRSTTWKWSPYWAGLAFSAATWCRPTSAILAAIVFGYLLWVNRPVARQYLIGVLPLAVALAAFNWYHLGSPFRFGQGQMGDLAIEKAGAAGVFQTPILEGAAGLLFSPARGLFIYSPFLLFGLWGAVHCWFPGGQRWLRPITVALAVIWAIEFKHFDWWGGWSFGYRHLVDTTVLLCFMMVPLLPRILGQPLLRVACLLLITWSIAVQWLAILAYDVRGWNAREEFVITFPSGKQAIVEDRELAERLAARDRGQVQTRSFDIDNPEHRARLWSWRDNQITYLLGHYGQSREERRRGLAIFLEPRAAKLARTHEELGKRFLEAGDRDAATRELSRAIEVGGDAARLQKFIDEMVTDGKSTSEDEM
jgi:hypothetical protein